MIKFPSWNKAPCPACRSLSSGKVHQCETCGTVFSPVERSARAQSVLMSKLFSLTVLGGAALSAALLSWTFFTAPQHEQLSPRTEWPPAGSADTQVASAYRQFRQTINDARQGCEAASKALDLMIKAIDEGTANVYDGRRAAEYAQRACKAAQSAVGAIASPDLPTRHLGLSRHVIASCQQAMGARHAAAEDIADMLGVDRTMVAIDALEETSLDGERQARECTSGLRLLAGAAGVDLARLRD